MATSAGLKPENAALLVSVLGAANTLGRIVMGLVADMPGVSALVLTAITGFGGIIVIVITKYYCVLIPVAPAGLCCLVLCFCSSLISLVIITAIFGLTLSCAPTVTSALLVDLLGIQLLTSR